LHAEDAMARVEAGEIIEITRHNRTIAELRPRRGAGDAEWNAAAKAMVVAMREGFDLGGGPFTEEDRYGSAAL
jgi:antitoxin (DNA-binding transcriptional repressor) of toxin-antitoxin stability system